MELPVIRVAFIYCQAIVRPRPFLIRIHLHNIEYATCELFVAFSQLRIFNVSDNNRGQTVKINIMPFFSKIFGGKNKTSSKSLTTITRTETYEGFSIPGIIHNMQYHFTNLQVYKDGLVYCWDMVDLKLFKEKLKSGWVVTHIPDGEYISLFSLGHWTIDNSSWDFNSADSYYDYVYSLVKILNPNLENLYNCHGTTEKIVGNVRVSALAMPNPKPYYEYGESKIFPERIKGKNLNIFYRSEDHKLYLAQLSIFVDGKIEIANIPEKKYFTIDQVEELITNKTLLTNLPFKERVIILGLGSFDIVNGAGVDIKDKYAEILDVYEELKSGKNSFERCREALSKYKSSPSDELKEELKVAYEKVPRHQRMFVGDMDTKDHEVKQIIYGKNHSSDT